MTVKTRTGTAPSLARRWALAAKRLIDLGVAAAGLAVLSPLFLLIAVAARLFSRGGPVIFSQIRCGLRGRRFRIYKFRTMIVGAEKMKDEIAHLNELAGPAFKSFRDPRVTRVGQVLRRFSLDELPQLWNVLKGDMSLVGPRPLPTEEAEGCSPEQRRRMDVRPGLVCLWQVRGRSLITDFDEWMRLDLRYVDSWSLGLDMEILFRAVPAVLSGRGAR